MLPCSLEVLLCCGEFSWNRIVSVKPSLAVQQEPSRLPLYLYSSILYSYLFLCLDLDLPIQYIHHVAQELIQGSVEVRIGVRSPRTGDTEG